MLVDKVGDHFQAADAHESITPLVCPLKLEQNSVKEEFYHGWQLSVQDGYKRDEDMGEVGRRALGFQNCLGKETFTSE